MDQLDSTIEDELYLFVQINHENIVRYFDHFHKRIVSQHKTFLYSLNIVRLVDKTSPIIIYQTIGYLNPI